MNDVIISVCISVHNTADYLMRALNSVVQQDIPQMEIVIVNNGSTDDSEMLMWKFKRDHPEVNIIIISQEDRGLAQGRQTGINNSSGKFITFLDADDYLLPNAYKSILRYKSCIEADIYEFQTYRDSKVIKSPYADVQNSKVVLKDYLQGRQIPTMLWLRWYRRDLFEQSVLPDMYVNNEDNFALPCLLFRANTIAYIPEVLHVYSTDNEGGVMISFEKDKGLKLKYYENRVKTLLAISHIRNYIGFDVIKKNYEKAFSKFEVRVLTNFLFTMIDGVSYKEKMASVLSKTDFESEKLIERYIRRNCVPEGLFSILIKVFGVRITYLFYYICRRK